jgi:hypothetical protein
MAKYQFRGSKIYDEIIANDSLTDEQKAFIYTAVNRSPNLLQQWHYSTPESMLILPITKAEKSTIE